MIRARSAEWLAARRDLITATDIPVILGLSPYKSEARLAAEKGGAEPDGETLRMRLGLAMEPFIAAEYERTTRTRVRRFGGLVTHRRLTWAAATPDYRAVGRRLDVEIKWSTARSRWADGLPQDIEAQVRWQLGVLAYPEAEVAALVNDDLRVFPVTHDEATFAGLVDIAGDFRRRLAEGGPFAHDSASIRARYPSDDGSSIAADSDLTDAVTALLAVRDNRKRLEGDEERLEVAIKQRMGEAALLTGPGWHVTWRRTKDVTTTDWRGLAERLLQDMPETERTALVGLLSTVRPGFRPLRIVTGKEE